jgi:hypothetical protein
VVGDSAGGGGGLFESAVAGSGFAGVENAAVGVGDGVGEFASEGGDAGEALEEVEGDAFASEEEAGGGFDGGQDGVDGDLVTVVVEKGDGVLVDFREEVEAGDDQGFAGKESAMGLGGLGYARIGGDVAGTDVFLEGETD